MSTSCSDQVVSMQMDSCSALFIPAAHHHAECLICSLLVVMLHLHGSQRIKQILDIRDPGRTICIELLNNVLKTWYDQSMM